jgi:hypothetical protein
MVIWGESKNFLKKVSFSRHNPHSLLQKLSLHLFAKQIDA